MRGFANGSSFFVPHVLLVVKQPQTHLTNRFVEALTDAARHYLEKSKLPSVIESKLDRANVRVEDLEDVPEEHFSDSDEESDQATKLTSLDTKDTMSVFYKPVGEWASLASQPIENARVIKTLHGTHLTHHSLIVLSQICLQLAQCAKLSSNEVA